MKQGYGAAAAPVCTTVYEDECTTVSEQKILRIFCGAIVINCVAE